jgi:beta-glucosidase
LSFPFRDPDLPLDARLDDLLGRLTLAEKVAFMHQHQPAIERLGVEPFHTGMEAVHGVAWEGPATVFPQPVGLASMWNPALVQRVGAAVGDEARGMHRRDPRRVGLNAWAPVVNLLRDPRWGRNEEGYAEDPTLTGSVATAFARGLRGDHPFYLKTAPTLKHFLAYNLEDDRDTVSVSVRPRVLREYELKAFEPALAAGAATGVMLSYNLVNGRPAHLSPLVDDVVRTWSRDELLVVSDAFGPSNIVNRQRYHPDHATAHAAAVRAGLDSFTDQGPDPSLTIAAIEEALARGLLDEADLDRAVRRTLSIRFRLGELDPPERCPYAAITDAVVDSPPHRALAREAAGQAIVLLKNDGLLPLGPRDTASVAVIGPLADTLFEDWYSGTLPYEVTPFGGLSARLGAAAVTCREGVDRIALRVAATGQYVAGGEFAVYDWGRGVCTLRAAANRRWLTLTDEESGALAATSRQPRGWIVAEAFRILPRGAAFIVQSAANGRYVTATVEGALAASATSPEDATRFLRETVANGLQEAAAAARRADVAVVVVGNAPCINGRETQDRTDIALPPAQERLVRAVAAANPRTVLAVESSYPMAIAWAAEHVPAILWSSHGGQELGAALADVLLGDRAPAGRLTQTWYRSTAEVGDVADYDIIGSRRTYLYFEGAPLYPFGHGLTYTTFRYGDVRLSPCPVDAGGTVTATVEVTNTGPTAGDEVVQLYTAGRSTRVDQPVRRLVAFERASYQPGQTRTLTFTLPTSDLAIWDVAQGRFAIEPGVYDVMAGPSSADIRCATALHVEGTPLPRRMATGRTRAADFDHHRGVRITDETKTSGDAVAPAGRRAWIGFREMDFGGGAGRFSATVASAAGGTIEVRLDDPYGQLAARVDVPVTGDRHAWTAAAAPAHPVGGVHDLFLVLSGDVNLSTFSFEETT